AVIYSPLNNPAAGKAVGCSRIWLDAPFHPQNLILTTDPAFVIWINMDFVELMPGYVGLPCPVVARRAKSNLSLRSFSEDGSCCRYTIHHFRFIRTKKAIP
ncbi:MAG: hypothetical protein KJP23_18045, partial [Deltaproteobacteria bacterium]|nr:hypothetical protein [Deltaproteobacteria bacterium]